MSDRPHHRQPVSIKETLISIMIAFVMAFVFRAFVIEAFRIPTGSMAPTLMGAHTRFRGPMTGATWQVGPWQETRGGVPTPTQNVTVHDPNLVPYPGIPGMSSARRDQSTIQQTKPTLSGDRILVFKYLPPLLSPQRFDICVFKFPGGPQEAYIKRLVGLPGEQVALVDGDVFIRTLTPRKGPNGAEIWAPTEEEINQPGGTWDLTGWEIARKPERVQREVWQPIYDADFAPRTPFALAGARRWFEPPWQPQSPGWDGLDTRSYTYSADRPTVLTWDQDAWPIVDWYPYNEVAPFWGPRPGGGAPMVYPVGDVRIRMGYAPQLEGVALTMGLTTRSTQFRAVIDGRSASIQMRPQPTGEAPDPTWETLESVELRAAPAPGRIAEVEFWHVDQSLSLYIDGKRVAHKPYYWSPSQRIARATGLSAEQILESEGGGFSPLHDPDRYSPAAPEIQLSGPATLHRVAVDRDIYYQPGASRIFRGAHPRDKLVILNRDQFFTCGDNSPSSLDGRMWDRVDPWVAEIDDTPGIVPRSLMVGRAFLVYFPSLHKEGGPLVAPDFGRLRFLY